MGPGLEEPLFLDNSLYRVLGTITLTPWISERPEEKIFFWGGGSDISMIFGCFF